MNNEDLMLVLAEYFLIEFPSDNPTINEKEIKMKKLKLQQKLSSTVTAYDELELDADAENYKLALQTIRKMSEDEYQDLIKGFRNSFNFSESDLPQIQTEGYSTEEKETEEESKTQNKKGLSFFPFSKKEKDSKK